MPRSRFGKEVAADEVIYSNFIFLILEIVRFEPVKRGKFSRKQALELRNATRATPDRLDINPRPIYRTQLLTRNSVPSAHSQTACILLYYRLGDCGAPLEDCNEGCTPHERSQLCEMERYKLHIARQYSPASSLRSLAVIDARRNILMTQAVHSSL